jgi:hypothetical protein
MHRPWPSPMPLPAGAGIWSRTVPRLGGRQQSSCSLRRFKPRHGPGALSGGGSPDARSGQSHRGVFRGLGRHDSTSLHPFAPPELPGFFATMGALTPARRLFVSRDNELRLDPDRSPCFMFSNRPILPSPTTCRRPDAILGFATSGLPDHAHVAAPFGAMRQLGFAIP